MKMDTIRSRILILSSLDPVLGFGGVKELGSHTLRVFMRAESSKPLGVSVTGSFGGSIV